ncbi:33181_t:CDS:2 [Racocetra persica]|uniref:33181_t:CDS:1 n=1 Tax=Racocetra persica TaxID=160502 RepID=A0ACA9MX91_9GLOM|nr:33181_t:CDS:2 [Racocetra persica]
MTDTIRKTEKEKKNSSFKKEVIERIESSLATRNLNIEDLELNNRGYKEEINRIKIDDSDKSFEEITGIEKRVKTDMEFKRKMLSRKNSKSERELDVNMDIYEKESAHGLKSIGKKLKQKAVKVVKSHSNPQVLEASSGQQQWEYVTHPEDLARKQKIIESPVRRLKEESKKVEADYQKLIDDKNKEINQLKQQNQDLEKKLSGLLQTKQHEIKEIESQKNNEFIKQSAIEIPLTLTPGNKKTNDLQQVVVKNVKVADLEADIRNNQNRLEKLVSSAKNELKSNSMNPQKAKTKTDDYQSYLDEFLKLQELITNSENNSDQEIPKKLGEIRKIKEQVIKLEIQKLAMIKNRANLLPLENFSADFQPQVLTTQRQNLNTADFTHVVSFIDDSSSKPLPSRPTEEENNAQQEQNNQEVQIQIPPKSNN